MLAHCCRHHRAAVPSRRALLLGLTLLVATCPAGTVRHAAQGKPVQLVTAANPRYPGRAGPAVLTDGNLGDPGFGSGGWLGWEGPDMEATVDLAGPTVIRSLAADFLQVTAAGIFIPPTVEFALSEDGKEFRVVATVKSDTPEREPGPLVRLLATGELNERARFVRVHAFSVRKIPAWHASAPGIPAWLFCDEILVNPKPAATSAFECLKTYEFGQSREPLAWIEARVRAPELGAAERAALHSDLVAVLTGAATTEAKRFACRQLALVGTVEDVAVLASLLPEPDLSDMARYALAAIPDPAATAALASALTRTQGKARLGILTALTARGDATASAAVAPLLADPDAATAATAGLALAAMPDRAAVQAIRSAFAAATPERKCVLAEACLLGADRRRGAGDRELALDLYAAVYAAVQEREPRTAALAGLIGCGHAEARTWWLAALDDADEKTRLPALSIVRNTGSQEALHYLAENLAKLQPVTQAAVLGILADRRETWAQPLACGLVAGEARDVRVAALQALARLGDSRVVPAVVQAISRAADDAERDTARRALERLEDGRTDQALLAAMATVDSATRLHLIRALAVRHASTATPALLELAKTAPAPERQEAVKALGVLATGSELPPLLELLLAAADPADRATLEPAVGAVGQRAPAASRPARLILQALARAPNRDIEAGLLTLLGRLPDAESLPRLRAALQAPDPVVRSAAIKALSAWPEDAPFKDLLDLAAGTAPEAERVLALRACTNLARLRASVRPQETTVALLRSGLAAAWRDDERRAILSVLADLSQVEALQLAATCLATPALQAEAEATVLKLAETCQPTAPDAVAAVLNRIATGSGTEASRQAARRLLDSRADRKAEGAPK